MGVVMRGGDFGNKKITLIDCVAFPVCLGDGELDVCGSLVIFLRLLGRK
jgi:hypothetical protein